MASGSGTDLPTQPRRSARLRTRATTGPRVRRASVDPGRAPRTGDHDPIDFTENAFLLEGNLLVILANKRGWGSTK